MFRMKHKLMETKPFDVARDSWRQMQRNAMRAVGEHWHGEMLPNHFTTQAKHTYQHQPRSKKYLERKSRMGRYGKARMGGLVDNVLTGELMMAVTKKAVIRGFPTRCTVHMFGPDYLRINFKKSTNQPNKKRELLTTTTKEAAILKALMVRVMREQLRNYRGRRRTTKI